jgi:hypothetical protein
MSFNIAVKTTNTLKQHRFRIVAPGPDYYQMDIAFFGKPGEIREYHAIPFEDRRLFLIIIGVNNRFVWGIRIYGKDAFTIKKSLNLFTEFPNFRKPANNAPVYIDCDGERSFRSIGGKVELPKIYKATNATIIIRNRRLSSKGIA